MDTKKPYETFGSLANVKSYTDITKQWLTMETTLPPSKPSDCYGHFSNGSPCLPHSVMLFHNGDLVGKAISEFTGIDLPFKQNDYGQEHGVRMLSWTVRDIVSSTLLYLFLGLIPSFLADTCSILSI